MTLIETNSSFFMVNKTGSCQILNDFKGWTGLHLLGQQMFWWRNPLQPAFYMTGRESCLLSPSLSWVALIGLEEICNRLQNLDICWGYYCWWKYLLLCIETYVNISSMLATELIKVLKFFAQLNVRLNKSPGKSWSKCSYSMKAKDITCAVFTKKPLANSN